MVNVRKILKHALATLWPSAMLIKGNPVSNHVALTFDDGPHPENTQRILDILNQNGAIATFFLQGSEVEKHPQLAREILACGHQIGNHGYAHFDAKKNPLRAYIDDIHHAQNILQDVTGIRLEKLFRPPFGNITSMAFILLALNGYRFVFWSADSQDSFIKNPLKLVAHVETMNITSGDILLFHEDYYHTVTALPAILKAIRQRKLTFSKIADI